MATNANGKRRATEGGGNMTKKFQSSSPVDASLKSNDSPAKDLHVTISLSSGSITIPASTLTQHSSWFADKLETSFKPVEDSRDIYLSIDGECHRKVPMLVCLNPKKKSVKDATEPAEETNENARSAASASPSVKVKAEPSSQPDGITDSSNDMLLSKNLVESTYSLLLDAYRGKQIRFPREPQLAFNTCIQLCSLAEAYGSLGLVKPFVRSVIFEHMNNLFTAIAVDPPAWVQFSIQLKSKSIFKEALVHLCGAAPAWPFSTPRDAIPESIQKTIDDKSHRLHMRVLRTVQDVMQNTIMVEAEADDEERKKYRAASLTRGPDSWLLVQIFRDYLFGRLRQLRVPDSPKDEMFSSLDSTRIGIFLRRLRQGGDAYLPITQVMHEIQEARLDGFMEWDAVADDMKALKTHASRVVQSFCTNNLMLPVETTKIGYLTCVEITDDDMPWNHDG